MSRQGCRIEITGIVQGVGFRPFVHSLAQRLHLNGWVLNTNAGVEIEVSGSQDNLAAFQKSLQAEAPPMAYIDSFKARSCTANGATSFDILPSKEIPGASQLISPDVGLCPDCLAELLDPVDRHYRYPFTNCTNCGPRFTIIEALPYDRPLTSMASFEMCPECAREYADPADRRFHAQPVACPQCGLQIFLEQDGENLAQRDEALQQARRLLAAGKILAIKGIGGFHLACDAFNDQAISELRMRKQRPEKAMALMMASVEQVQKHCYVSPIEEKFLLANQRPIVLLNLRPESALSPLIAPGQKKVGVMLPYTPLHMLLTEPEQGFPGALILTSANLAGEPIIRTNQAAREKLGSLADVLLMHDRPILRPCDDSVLVLPSAASTTSMRGKPQFLRRSRGFAPLPISFSTELPQLLALGGEFKNTFCLSRGKHAFLSPHIGEMSNFLTQQSFASYIDDLEQLFQVQPQVLVHDLHPDYASTRYALERAQQGIPAIGVQHHHAHIASCLAEHNWPADEAVIGLAFDGTGYGEDGAIWGGEVLLANYTDFERLFHLKYTPLLGAEAAVHEPARMALSHLWTSDLELLVDFPPLAHFSSFEATLLRQEFDRRINSPLTSSMGRLFDAVASLVGLRHKVSYEAQAAIELEALIDSREQGTYNFSIAGAEIDPAPMFRELIKDLSAGLSPALISARFHNGLAQMALDICLNIRADHAVNTVALSGGVWQNLYLLERTCTLLMKDDFSVLTHQKVPANDGGLSLGQLIIAAHCQESEKNISQPTKRAKQCA